MISIWKLNINHTITSIQQHHDHLITTPHNHMINNKQKTIKKRFSLNLPPNNHNNDTTGKQNNNNDYYEFHIVFSTGCNAFQDCKCLNNYLHL